MKLTDGVTALSGIGEKKAELLEKLNIKKIEDFLFFFPRDYQDRRNVTCVKDLSHGESFLIKTTVRHIINKNTYSKKMFTLRLLTEDESGSVEIIFFNAKYLANSFKQGEEYYFYGKASKGKAGPEMLHPEFSLSGKSGESGEIIPIYPLTAGISQNEMRKFQRSAGVLINEISEYIPDDIIKNNRLCDINYAVSNIHFPKDEQKYKEAKYRLVFDELFLLQTGLLAVKSSCQSGIGGIKFSKDVNIDDYINNMPYKLTKAQSRVVSEITADMESEKIMNRLVQGDVGSGKTAVAEIALYKACICGYQGVLMAPTELLANQHYNTLKKSFSAFGIEVSFISGNMGAKERKEKLQSLKEGKTKIVVGTHAIIQPDVEFKNLGLVITDEQHRFGVNQRQLLMQKGKNPDILVMSATPIPRTLAMILYGDLDISVIDEMPPGRQKIITKSINEPQRDTAYQLMREELEAGRQGYVVAPLIDDSEVISSRSAGSIYEELVKSFSKYKVALMHGEMKQKEKDLTMQSFYRGEINLLVSTVVIEVGINVPNATMMIIENAERFGLAQLHQLRGRVGRGSEKSYCALIVYSKAGLALKRAETMAKTTDGFEIAEQDLQLRGPGEFFGTKQHGIPDLKIANLFKHIDILETVRKESKKLLEKDKDLSLPEHFGLKQKIKGQFEIAL